MKTTALRFFHLAAVVPAVLLLMEQSSAQGQGDRSQVPTYALETPDLYNVPPGADPSVSAEDGGAGFEEIAESEGWQTGVITPDEALLLGSPDAVKGGEIRLSVPDFPATFRPYGKDENTQVGHLISSLVYEGLIRINPLTLEFMPALASHWRVGEDGQTFYFRLNPEARFSDGHPVTTDDVLATYRLVTDEGILSPYTNTFYSSFEKPRAISKYIFSIRAREEGWKNLSYFGGTVILPAHVIGNLSGHQYLMQYQYGMVPGTGPYMVQPESITKGERVSLTRRTNYWAGDYAQNQGSYNFDRITLLVVPNEHLELEAFRSGKTDLYLISRAQWYEEEFNDERTKRGLVQVRRIYNNSPQGFSGLVFNMRDEPFKDPRVREAICYLFNREEIVRDLMYDQYSMTDSYFPGSEYENPNNPKIRYDPEKALTLLAETGYRNRNRDGILVHESSGDPLEIEMLADDAIIRFMTPVQENWKEHGVKLSFRQVDVPTQFKRLNERVFQMAYMSWGGLIYPNPTTMFHSDLADTWNTANLAGFRNSRADSLMDLEQVAFNQPERIRILRELDSILVASHQYALAWYAPFTRVAYWNRFGHPDFYIGRINDWQDILRCWWISPEKSQRLSEALENDSIDLGEGERDVRFWR